MRNERRLCLRAKESDSLMRVKKVEQNGCDTQSTEH